MHPTITTAMAQAHQQDLLRAARAARQAAQIPPEPGRLTRIRISVGAHLPRHTDVPATMSAHVTSR